MMPRASELLYGILVEGSQVKLSQIEGADIEVVRVGFFEDDFAPGAALVFTQGDLLGWVVTYSAVLLEGLDKLKGREPYTARFISHKSASGRTYWTIE